MATKLKIKRSAVASNPPTTGQLELGELAMNTNDGKLYLKKDDGAEAIVALQNEPSEGAFADGDKTKLDGIETGADVTDTTNVTAAGALMDSEVTNLAQVKAFDSSDYATAAQGALADSALQDITGESIESLSDVNTMTPSDGQVLTWDNGNSRWDAADAASGDVTKVDLTHTSGAVALDLSAGDQFTFDADAYTPTSPITYVAGRAERISSNGPLSLPAGLQEGDIVVLSAIRNGNYCGPSSPQGWTVLEDGLIASSDYAHFSYKVMGSTPDTSVNVYGDPDAVYSVVAFRGVDSTTPIDATHGYVDYVSDTTPAPPSVTTATSNAMILTSIATRNPYLAQASTTIPSGYTHASDAYALENNSGVNNAYKILAAAGSESPGDWSGTSHYYTRSALLTLPLRQQSEGGEKDYTITLSNAPTKGAARIVINKDHEDQTFDWSGVTQWTGGSEPTLAVGINIIDLTFDGAVITGTLIGSEDTLVLNGGVTEKVHTVTGTTPTISATNGTVQLWTFTANSTPAFDLDEGQSVTLYIDDGSGYTLTDTNVDVWDTSDGSAPTLFATGYSIIMFAKVGGQIRGLPGKVDV